MCEAMQSQIANNRPRSIYVYMAQVREDVKSTHEQMTTKYDR